MIINTYFKIKLNKNIENCVFYLWAVMLEDGAQYDANILDFPMDAAELLATTQTEIFLVIHKSTIR